MSETYGYGFGIMADGTDIYVVGTENDLADQDVEHGVVFEHSGNKWSGWSVDFTVAALAYARAVGQFFAVGQTGQVEVTTASKAWDETIDASDDGPSSIRPINGSCVTSHHVYVAGMQRQVYRRTLKSHNWERYDSGCLVDSASTEIHGFNAIHGLDDSELYAVGLHGEIWYCNSGKWQQLDSPTSTSLYVIRRLSNGKVIAGGGLGTILVGSAAGLYPIQHNMTKASITGIAEFKDHTFIADEAGQLYQLNEMKLELVHDIPKDDDGGGQLDDNDEAMVYVRGNSVLLFDGSAWHDRTPPDNP